MDASGRKCVSDMPNGVNTRRCRNVSSDSPATASTSAIKAAAAAGYLDEQAAVLEALTGIRRAGADIVITYHAKDAARWLQ